MQGRRVSESPWFDLGAMSTQPLQQRFEVSDTAGSSLAARVVMDTAYQGGSSLHITGICVV